MERREEEQGENMQKEVRNKGGRDVAERRGLKGSCGEQGKGGWAGS